MISSIYTVCISFGRKKVRIKRIYKELKLRSVDYISQPVYVSAKVGVENKFRLENFQKMNIF